MGYIQGEGRSQGTLGPAWMGRGKRSALGAVAAREGRSILPEKIWNNLNRLYPGI